MKDARILAALFSLGSLLSPLALSAKTIEQAYVESYAQAPVHAPESTPVPVTVVSPVASAGTGVVEVTFVVTTEGKPTEIAVRSTTDSELVEPVKEAVSQWKFVPARHNGEAVAQKVLLPIRFVQAD